MKSLLTLTCAVVLLAVASQRMRAEDACHPAGHSHCHTCGPICPKCSNKVCIPEVVPIKIKKECFNVECKEICIPKFRWPWECCDCLPECGRVRVVKVLKRQEYECEACGYKWTLHGACCR